MSAAIAEALLHFFWQGTVLGVLAYAFLRRAGSHAGARYALGLGTLTAMLLAPIVTTMWLLNESAGAAGAVFAGVAARRADVVPVEWVLGLWTFGVVVCGVRLAGGWVLARRLATDAVTPVAREIDAIASAVAERLSVSRTFKVVESAVAVTPMMVGWLTPVVLLPTAAIAGLSPRQLEAVIAHELAHIRRHDYLMNLLQSVVEALLFYHPAVWWVSKQVRDAREQCCDDLTVSVCDRLTYVSALSSVATLRAASPALAATGGSLRDRVERLLRPQPVATASVGWLAVIPIALVLISAAPVAVTPDAPVEQLVSIEQPVSVSPEATGQSSIAPIATTADPQSPILSPQFSNASPTILPALPVALDFFMPATQAMTLQAPPTAAPQAAPESHEVTVQGQVNAPDLVKQVSEVRPGLPVEVIVRSAPELSGTYILQPDGSLKRQGQQPVAAPAKVPALFFFVNGQVNKPGSYEWSEGMTVEKAVALAGGFLVTGKLSHIMRPEKDKDGKVIKYKKIKALKNNTPVFPGDELVIVRKWFG